MAEQSTLRIIIRAVDKVSGVLRKVGKNAVGVSDKLKKVGKSSLQAGVVLSAGLTVPIVAFGSAATRAFAEFEQGISNVSTLIDTTRVDMRGISEEVLRIGERTPVALNDLTAALFDIVSAGTKASEATKVLEGSARLAVAGLGSTKQAADLVTSAINAFQLEGKEAAGVYDVLFKTTKFGKTTIAELSQGFGSVAAVVKASGTPLDEFLAAVSAMTSTGAKAPVVYTQLRSVITALTKSTTQTKAVFESFGVDSLPALIKQTGGLIPALIAIRKRIRENTQSEGELNAKTLELVGRVEAYNAIVQITEGVTDKATGALKSMREEGVEVDNAFQKQNKTLQSEFKRTGNAVTKLKTEFGTALLPVIRVVTRLIKTLSGFFSGLSDDTQSYLAIMAVAAASIGPAIAAFGAMSTTLGVLFGPLGIVALVVAGFAGWVVAIKSVVDNWHLLVDEIEQGVDKIVGALSHITKFGDFLGDEFTDLIHGTGRPSARRGVRPQPGAAGPGGGQPAAPTGRMSVIFENAPPNARIQVDPQSELPLDVSTGRSLLVPQ